MDRFIGIVELLGLSDVPYLKSNMDRFIDSNKWRSEIADHI